MADLIQSMSKAFVQPRTNQILNLSDEDLAKRFTFDKELGYGNWGSVWRVEEKVESRNEKGNVLALKLVHRKVTSSTARVKALWNEYKLVKGLQTGTCSHPNIVQFQAFIITPGYALISMPLLDQQIPIGIPELVSKKYLIQLVSAVHYIHANGIIHGDLKPANIMLSLAGEPILIDFGFSSKIGELITSSTGTPEYSAPEVVGYDEAYDGIKSDIYSLGVSFYEVIVGRTPFEENEEEVFLTPAALEVYYERTRIGHFHGVVSVSPEFEKLIKYMIAPDPSKRMKTVDLAFHERFFAGFGPFTPPRDSVTKTFITPPSSAPRSSRKTRDGKGIKIYEDDRANETPKSASKYISKNVLGERSNQISNSIAKSRNPNPESITPIKQLPTTPSKQSSPFSLSRKKKSKPAITPVVVERVEKVSNINISRLEIAPSKNEPSTRSPARFLRKISGSINRSVSKISTGSTFSIRGAHEIEENQPAVSKIDLSSQRIRLDSFTERIQAIIDSKAPSLPIPPRPSRSLARKDRTIESDIEPILTATELKKFVASDRAVTPTSRRMNEEKAGLAPRPGSRASSRTNSFKNTSSSIAASSNIRKSLSPSFVSVDAKETLESKLVDVVPPLAPIESRFKRGHTRIPTAIRNVPAVIISDSPDSPDSNRAPTPAPADRVYSEGFILPTFVADSISSEEEEALFKDFDLNMEFSSPARKRTIIKSSVVSTKSKKSLATLAKSTKSELKSSPESGGTTKSVGKWKKMFMR